jgi:integrase
MTRQNLTPARLLGHRPTVRVYREGERLKCEWTEQGRRHYETRADTPAHRRELRAFAEGIFDRLTAPERRSRLTVRELWHRYEASEFDRLRPTTRQLYRSRWRRFELFVGGSTLADDVATETVGRFRAAAAKQNAAGQVRAMIRVAKIVWNWGETMELVDRNRVARYRFKGAKDDVQHTPGEYRTPEVQAILRALGGGQDGRKWKAWAAFQLACSQGERINAILHLTWSDVDLEAGVIHWPKATNKQGKDRSQPMTWDGYAALLTARRWADQRAHDPHLAHARRVASPYVIPAAGGADGAYRYQSFHAMLRRAETAAGVPHQPYRAAHGGRRMVAGNIAALTGDPWLALQFIGDTDPKRAKEYVQKRDDRMQAVADRREG